MKQLTRQEVESVVESFAKYYDDYQPYNDSCECSIKYGVCEKHKNIQCLITIGTVLQKMKENLQLWHIRGRLNKEPQDLIIKWLPLGLSKSLQEIVSESGYEIYTDLVYAELQLLRSPKANALFSFLIEIGL